MSPVATSRRRNDEGEVVLVKVRDPKLLVALREGKPDKKGRAGRHLSQRQIAADLTISHGHYGDIEAGRRNPSLEVGERIAAYHGLPLATLFDEIPLEYGDPDPSEAA